MNKNDFFAFHLSTHITYKQDYKCYNKLQILNKLQANFFILINNKLLLFSNTLILILVK